MGLLEVRVSFNHSISGGKFSSSVQTESKNKFKVNVTRIDS